MSSTERLANEFDLDLHRLMQRADRLSDDSRVKFEKDRWKDIANRLSDARIDARAMMSAADRKRTQEG